MKKLLYSIVSVILATMLAVSVFAQVPGDVNGDEYLNIVDALMVASAVVNGRTVNGADVNGDGKINLIDVISVLKLISKGEAPEVGGTDKSTADVVVENGTVKEAVSINGDVVSAAVPEGVAVKEDTTALTLSVSALDSVGGNIATTEDEDAISYDVHIDGVSEDNTVAIVVDLGAILPKGQNTGTVALYHVENGETVAMTQVMSLTELDSHNEFYYWPATGNVYVALATFSEVVAVTDKENVWDGTPDHKWYTEAEEGTTVYTIANANQLWSLSQIVGGMADGIAQDSFSGKTVKVAADIYIGDLDSENGKVFYPIGYYNTDGTYNRNEIGTDGTTSGFKTFEGTFDGMGHTISDFYQNTWEMVGDHDWYSAQEAYYRDGMGLFGRVYGGTVKNITVENFSSDGEITTTGTIAAYADYGATFENIAIFNCNPRVYNIGNGGIVGCVGWYTKGVTEDKVTFKNITVDNTNKISALWGSYDVACGGIVGQYYPTSGQTSAGSPKNPGIHFENCHVAAQMDVYNDVCANYQYYAYRYAGILMGSVRENETIDGHSYPKMDGITAKGCTVHFGDWNDYYYCELVANSLASYTHDHQMSRLEQVQSVNTANMKVTTLDGKTTDIPESGRVNYVVVKAKDSNGMWIHGDGHDYAECYHFVNGVQHFHDVPDADNPNPTETVNGVAGVLKEDKQLIYREFYNLVTGYGWGVTSKGVDDMDGVTILDRKVADSEVKFETKYKDYDTYLYRVGNENAVSLETLFSAVAGKKINESGVYVTIDRVYDTDNVSGTFTANTSDWEKGTIKFEGTGVVKITIQDYDYCTPTEIFVEIVNATNITNANVATAIDVANVAVLEDITNTCEVSYTGNIYGNNFDFSTGTVNIGGATVDDFVITE